MKIRGYLLEMAESEILQSIPTSKYLEIKQADPHPQFRAYVIGHEGKSTGKVIVDNRNIGTVIKRWYQSAIKGFFEKLKTGVQLFHGHNYDNSHEGRRSIGQVVGKALKTIGDKLSVIAIAYINPDYRNLPLDVASIEADIELTESGEEYEASVDNISGIALGHSETETPGFAGATLLSQVQEFAENKFQFSNGKGGNMTVDEIKAFIKSEKLSPLDLFPLGEIAETKDIKELIETESRKARQGEYEHRRRTDTKFDEERQKWEEKEKELNKTIDELKPLATQNKRVEVFEKLKTDRKLTDQEAAYIKRRLDKFEPEKIEEIEKEMNDFMDKSIDDFKADASVFGVKVESKKADDGDDNSKGGGSDKSDSDDIDDFIP